MRISVYTHTVHILYDNKCTPGRIPITSLSTQAPMGTAFDLKLPQLGATNFGAFLQRGSIVLRHFPTGPKLGENGHHGCNGSNHSHPVHVIHIYVRLWKTRHR